MLSFPTQGFKTLNFDLSEHGKNRNQKTKKRNS
jgi:hypothetical protein